jgi:hypothetical protein
MAHYTDWLPTTRDGQLAIAKDWVSVAGTNAHLWDIPLTAVQELGGLTEAADTTPGCGEKRNYQNAGGNGAV